jgi:hypothetical protein
MHVSLSLLGHRDRTNADWGHEIKHDGYRLIVRPGRTQSAAVSNASQPYDSCVRLSEGASRGLGLCSASRSLADKRFGAGAMRPVQNNARCATARRNIGNDDVTLLDPLSAST